MISTLIRNNVKPLLNKTLFDFLTSLNKDSLNILSSQIVQRFYDNKYRANSSLLNKVYDIYNKKNMQFKLKYFTNWKMQISNHNTSIEINNNIKDVDDYFNNTKQNINKHPIMLRKNNNNNSFTHNITKHNRSLTPIIVNSNRINTQQQQLSTISKRTNSASQIEIFLQRQEDYNNIKQRKLERRLNLNETALDGMCTFSPNISSHFHHSYSDSIKAAHIRLYEDSNVRKRKFQQKINEYVNTINSPKPHMKVINKSQIEKLYNDYKLRKTRRRMLMEKVNNEEGVTFKPVVHLSPHYLRNVNESFYERNRQSVENKQNFIMTYNYLREMELMEIRQKNLTRYLKDGNYNY